ncbi:TauD/TfdA family dioxygenase [Bacillales bacterium AN1005]
MESIKTIFNDYFIDINRPDYVEKIQEALNEKGLVTFNHDFTREEYVEFTKKFGSVYFHRKSDSDGADVITNMYEKNWYRKFTARTFEYHTDLSKNKLPPSLLFFYCKEVDTVGGESILLDGKKLYSELKENNPKMLNELCRPGSIIFGEDLLLGSFYEKLSENRMLIRFRYDNLIYFSISVMNLMPELQEMFEKQTLTFKLDSNQGYIANNGWWLHGRKSWEGDRKAYRMMINSEEPQGKNPLGFLI